MTKDAREPFEQIRDHALRQAPVVWMLGKAQAGKTSIVAEIVGRGYEDIGNGFKRQTLYTREYLFPEELPVIRFLDTRGLEDERNADLREEVERCQAEADVLMVVVRAEDLSLDTLLGTVRRIRRARKEIPLLVLQTRVHDLYEQGADHPHPYPYAQDGELKILPVLPHDVRRPLEAQRHAFASLPGSPPEFVVVDFTRPESGYHPVNFGAEALWNLFHRRLPEIEKRLRQGPDPAENIRRRIILPWAFAASALDALPIPVFGGLASGGVQMKLVHTVADRYALRFDRRLWLKFVGMLGATFSLRYGAKFLLRQGLKVVPAVGTASVALLSFGVTYGIGEVALYFCRELTEGREPERKEARRIYQEALREAQEIWRKR